MATKPTIVKVLVVGDHDTGKTSIIRRYVYKTLDEYSVEATIGMDIASKHVRVNNEIYKIQLWDIAGQHRFIGLAPTYYRHVVAALVVFDITNKASLMNAAKWKTDIDDKVFLPVILLANKWDLIEGNIKLKQVSDEELDEFCHQYKFIGWFAVSSKTGMNIKKAMNFTIRKIFENSKSVQSKKLKRAMPIVCEFKKKSIFSTYSSGSVISKDGAMHIYKGENVDAITLSLQNDKNVANIILQSEKSKPNLLLIQLNNTNYILSFSNKKNLKRCLQQIQETSPFVVVPKLKDEEEKEEKLQQNDLQQKEQVVAKETDAVSKNNDNLSAKQVRFKKYFKQIQNFGDEFDEIYYNKIHKEGYDDFKMMLCFDDEILSQEIGMKKMHRKYFLRKIKEFEQKTEKFKNWLYSIKMDEYHQCMINKGIMTFDIFYELFPNHYNGLINIIGVDNVNDAKYIWNNTPKIIRQNIQNNDKQNDAQNEGQ